jgi:hypothetical protein
MDNFCALQNRKFESFKNHASCKESKYYDQKDFQEIEEEIPNGKTEESITLD